MPFRQLFTKREQQFYSGVKKEQLMDKIVSFWGQSQFLTNCPGPFQIHGEHLQTKIGLRQVVDIWVQDAGNSVSIDMIFSAMLGDEEAVVGVVGAVVILPVVAAVGAVSYMEYENDARNLMSVFWSYLSSVVASLGGSQTSPIQMPARTTCASGMACPKCGLIADSDARFCKRCGERLQGG